MTADRDRPGPDAGGEGEGEPTLERRLRRLEEIVGRLEADDVELERALELFEEGVAHIRKAEEVLSRTELKVEELLGEEGETRTRAFEAGDPE